MPASLQQLNAIMEQASERLARMDYLNCESLCLEALALARRTERFGYYARVLLPLQEARRQRRMIAAAGDIRLGSGAGFDPNTWLAGHEAGCIVLTHPHSAEDARELHERARQEMRCVEVLYANNRQTDAEWMLRSFDGPAVGCAMTAPAPGTDPAQWFIDASERLGDAALAGVDTSLRGGALVDELEARLRAFIDHELLHQHLADAARAVRTVG